MLGNYKDDEKCIVGLTSILREAWNTTTNTEDKRKKIQALSLLKNAMLKIKRKPKIEKTSNYY